MTDPWAFQRWAFSVETGNPVRKAVLSMLAMMADATTGRCEARQGTIARGVEASERAVRGHLKALEDAGVIARREQRRFDGRRRGDEFLLLAPGVVEWPDGEVVELPADAASEGVDTRHEATETPGTDRPSHPAGSAGQELPPLERPPENDRSNAREDAPSSMTYRGRKVPRSVVDVAARSVRYFASKTGQTLRTVDGTGRASTSLQRVVGAMLAHPELADPDFAKRTIDFALAAPWWRDEGPPGVGVVFGPNVVERMVEQARRDEPPAARPPGGSGRPSASDLLRKLRA